MITIAADLVVGVEYFEDVENDDESVNEISWWRQE